MSIPHRGVENQGRFSAPWAAAPGWCGSGKKNLRTRGRTRQPRRKCKWPDCPCEFVCCPPRVIRGERGKDHESISPRASRDRDGDHGLSSSGGNPGPPGWRGSSAAASGSIAIGSCASGFITGIRRGVPRAPRRRGHHELVHAGELLQSSHARDRRRVRRGHTTRELQTRVPLAGLPDWDAWRICERLIQVENAEACKASATGCREPGVALHPSSARRDQPVSGSEPEAHTATRRRTTPGVSGQNTIQNA
jgi:hypothetical protein